MKTQQAYGLDILGRTDHVTSFSVSGGNLIVYFRLSLI